MLIGSVTVGFGVFPFSNIIVKVSMDKNSISFEMIVLIAAIKISELIVGVIGDAVLFSKTFKDKIGFVLWV